MAFVYQPDATTTVSVSDNDFLHVPRDVSVHMSNACAISHSNGESVSIMIDGSVVSLGPDAINFAPSGTSGHITVGRTGTVRAGGADAIDAGVYLRGAGARLSNAGVISGGVGDGIRVLGSIGPLIVNAGVISGAPGIALDAFGHTRIVNTGEILGHDLGLGAVRAISASNTATLVNRGAISGPESAVHLGDGVDKVVNSGELSGDVSMGDGTGRRVNPGDILGDVAMESGDDVITDFTDAVDKLDFPVFPLGTNPWTKLLPAISCNSADVPIDMTVLGGEGTLFLEGVGPGFNVDDFIL